MSASKTNIFCTPNLLLPVALVSLVLFISIGFQTTLVFRERALLHQTMNQQDKPLEDLRRMETRTTALAQGTLKLAQHGDKNAQTIIDNLKKSGVTVALPPGASAPPAHIATPSKP